MSSVIKLHKGTVFTSTMPSYFQELFPKAAGKSQGVLWTKKKTEAMEFYQSGELEKTLQYILENSDFENSIEVIAA